MKFNLTNTLAIDALKEASKLYPPLTIKWKYNLNQITKPLATYQETLTNYYNGQGFEILDKEWLLKTRISEEQFKHRPDFQALLVKAIVLYHKATPEPRAPDYFAYTGYCTSPALQFMNIVLRSDHATNLETILGPNINTLWVTPLIDLVEWYSLNQERLQSGNRGSIHFSPLRKIEVLLKDYYTFCVNSQATSISLNSPIWYEYVKVLRDVHSVDPYCDQGVTVIKKHSPESLEAPGTVFGFKL